MPNSPVAAAAHTVIAARPSHEAHDRQRGIAFATSGFVLLSMGDAIIKTMAGEWPGTAVAALRYVIGTLLLAAVLMAREGRGGFTVERIPLQWARGFAAAAATLCFFLSLFAMPMADATAIAFLNPVLTVVFGRLLLKERVPRTTWIALPLAMAGVVVVLRPNFAELGAAALLPLASATAFSALMLLNRITARDASPLGAQFWLAATAAPLLLVAAAVGHASGVQRFAVEWPHWSVVLRCAVVACTASAAHMLVFQGSRIANATAIAPATYVQILVAGAAGWLLFGDRPDLGTLAGAALIIGAGVLIWRGSATKPSARRAVR